MSNSTEVRRRALIEELVAALQEAIPGREWRIRASEVDLETGEFMLEARTRVHEDGPDMGIFVPEKTINMGREELVLELQREWERTAP